jgi:nicotinamide-nucleotide amidase
LRSAIFIEVIIMTNERTSISGELITIGDELLSGRTVNNNAAHLGHHLRLAGFQIRWTTVVGDREEDIVAALQRAMERAPFVLVTGGLGPTADDRTSAAVALALGTRLRRDPESWEVISSHLKKHNIPMTRGIAKMAELPEGARRIDLARPRAGYYMSYADKPLFFLPGVPEEMADMLKTFVLPTLKKRFPEQITIHSQILRIFGLRESEIAERLAEVEKKHSTVGFGYFPHFPENSVSLTVQATTATSADAILEKVVEAVVQELGLYVYGRGDDRLEMVVGRSLMDNGCTLALAESCTGGLIAHLITSAPGSSAYFDRSMVAYSDAAKTSHLLVSPDLISQHGAVSAQVAEAMVRGLRTESEPNIALAVTGLAGPTGGTPEKPVGTVFLALLSAKGLRTERFQFGGEREKIKLAAAYTALDWLRRAIIDESFFDTG